MEVITNWEIHSGEDFHQALCRLDREFREPRWTRYTEGYVFDENQTVKWNREEVARRNQEMQTEVLQIRELKSQSHEFLYSELMRYIMHESVCGVHFTEQEARAIWQHILNHHDSNPWDWVDEMAETCYEFNLIGRNKNEGIA